MRGRGRAAREAGVRVLVVFFWVLVVVFRRRWSYAAGMGESVAEGRGWGAVEEAGQGAGVGGVGGGERAGQGVPI